jgi:CheY-specific phosphatase CheX
MVSLPNESAGRTRLLLAAAAESALDSMFFEALSSEPAEAPSPPPEALRATVSYRGSRSGRLAVAVLPETAVSLSANFLGSGPDAPVEEALAWSTLTEFTNIVCGSFLSHLDSYGAFRIDPPQRDEAPPGAGWLELPTDAGPVWVWLTEE